MNREMRRQFGRMNRPDIAGLLSKAMQNPEFANNSRAQNTMDMLQKHDTEGLMNLAQNIARQHGTTFEEVSRQMQGLFNR